MSMQVYRVYIRAQAAAEALLLAYAMKETATDQHYLGVAREKLREAEGELDKFMRPPTEGVAAG